MAENRQLYGLHPLPNEPHKPKPHPFSATSRHERWCLDIRYLEKHRIPEIGVITFFRTISPAKRQGKQATSAALTERKAS
jgi:hypothetical protein